MEERLDKLLVQLNLVDTRSEAEKIILEIGVHVNGKIINKPGKKFKKDCHIKFIDNSKQWLSIDANKIVSAIDKWNLEISGNVFLDVFSGLGASTEVLFSNKAKKVYLNDSVKDSYSNSLSVNNIVNSTGLYLRELTSSHVSEKLDGCIINSSDTLMSKTLPFVHPFLNKGAFVIVVIKPRVEVDKNNLKNNGELRNSLGYSSMFVKLKETAEVNNLDLLDYFKSPILGDDGKEEFILYLRKI